MILVIAAAFVAGSIVTGTIAFADEPQTFEQACAEVLEDDDINLEGLLCQAIFGIQDELDNLSQGVQIDPQGNTQVSSDLDVSGDTSLHDTTISSTLTVGGTTIASETGNVK